MSYLNFRSQYNCFPKIKIKNFSHEVVEDYNSIVLYLQKILKPQTKVILVIECYPGVRYNELKRQLVEKLAPTNIFCSDDFLLPLETRNKLIQKNLTNDPVFGRISTHQMEEFFDLDQIQNFQKKLTDKTNLTIVYGTGASIVAPLNSDYLIYADLARWEIQKRMRSNEIGNWGIQNLADPILSKYKRGFFIDWRIADRLKQKLFEKIDFLLDTNLKNYAKMITGKDFRNALKESSHKPFRLVPYFDSGIWGGQWMKEVCNLDPKPLNYAWCFDGVPEENSIYLEFKDKYIEIPSINLVFYAPIDLLGTRVHARFGKEFPIRFDLLDTMEGQNLSLQVHPLTEYIQEQFSMHYTQDESYYLLDAKKDASVYLGVKNNTSSKELLNSLKDANEKNIPFEDNKYINHFSAKKHDHFLIPAGTIHSAGKDGLILEISATPYIFTFKLWDWNRVGLDGKPRPIHLKHGKNVIQFDRDETFCKNELVNQFEVLSENENYKEEKTGLHEREFIETRRFTIYNKATLNTHHSVNMLNLIEGEKIFIKSIDGSFEDFEVNYAETFIIPESCKEYIVDSLGKTIMLLQAFVRTSV